MVSGFGHVAAAAAKAAIQAALQAELDRLLQVPFGVRGCTRLGELSGRDSGVLLTVVLAMLG
jgi:hypothetical protein